MFPSFHNRISILAKTEVAKFWQSVNFLVRILDGNKGFMTSVTLNSKHSNFLVNFEK